MQVIGTGLGLHDRIRPFRLGAVETFRVVAPLLEETRSIHGPGPRPYVQSYRRIALRHSRPGLRRAISFKLALVADRETAVVAVPLGRALARVRRDAPPTILAFLLTYGCSAVLARPLRGTGTRVRPRAVPAVAASSSTNRSGTICVEPAVLALARVRRDAFSAIRALLDA